LPGRPPAPGPTILRCTPADLPALREIGRETYDQAFRSLNRPEVMDAYLAEAFALEKLRDEMARPGSSFWFLFVDGERAGYTKLNEAPDQSDINDTASLELERIYVRRRFQGKGLGSVLLEHAVSEAHRRGKAWIWLGVWEKNSDAISFYRRKGFTVAGRHSFRMGEELQSDLVMRRNLAGGPDGPGEPRRDLLA
jgi:diamine N-acetyltransferase